MIFKEELKGIPEGQVKVVRKDLRQKAKAPRFTFSYRGTAKALHANTGLPLEECEQIFIAYFEAFPGIKDYFAKQEKDMWDNGYILIDKKSGMRSYVPNWESFKWLDDNKNRYEGIWDIYKEGKDRFSRDLSVEITYPDILETIKLMQQGFSILDIGTTIRKPYQDLVFSTLRAMFKTKSSYANKSANMPSQGSSAHMTKCALINYYKSLIRRDKVFKYLIINAVHDEALIEVPEEVAQEEAKLLQKCMEDASNYFCTNVKIKAVPEIGDHWIH